jgi:hypothetical protein
MPDDGFDPIRIVAAFRSRDAAFVLAGGVAAAARGSAVTTADVEVCVDGDDANLRRVGLALEDLVASPAPAEGDDEHRVTFGSVAGRFTIVEVPDGFAALRDRAEETDLGRGVVVRIAAVEDLVDLARTHGDLEAAAHLASLSPDDGETEPAEDPAGSGAGRRERMWSALERVDSFLNDLDTKRPKRHREP